MAWPPALKSLGCRDGAVWISGNWPIAVLMGLVALAGGGAALAPGGSARGQVPQQDRPRDARDMFDGVFDPQTFFERWMGAQTPEQQRAWDEVTIAREEEQRFGRQAADRFLADLRRQGIRVVSRGPEVNYLRALVEEVRPRMRHADRYPSITVWFAESSDTDARCFPGGILVVYRGLLAVARSEAALVGILGHELSHIDHGHQLRHLKALKLAQNPFQGGPRRFDFRDLMNNTWLMTQTFARPFRPEDETQADLDGATWAYEAGYDPREMAQLFLTLHRRDGERAGGGVPSFLRSHPFHRDRYEAILKRYEELLATRPRDDLYRGVQNLQQLVPRRQRRFDE
jgi:predicted Zn-dependent protease